MYGGTSLSSPLIAAMYGLAGNTGELGTGIAKHLYANAEAPVRRHHRQQRHLPARVAVHLPSRKGYDGPTGLGTPNGLGAL